MSEKGRAIAHSGIKQVEIREYPLPTVEKGSVLMSVKMANICGSDVHIWRGEHPLKWIVMGHEMMGTIERLGEGVKTDFANQPVQVGDRIVPVYWITCYTCEACKRGEFNMCENAYMYKKNPAGTYPYFTGGFGSHYFIHPNQHFYKLPDSIPDQVAAGLNCGISQMYYVVDKAEIADYETVVFQGSGGLGLFGSAVAKEKAATVIVIDRFKERLAEAKRFGADYTIDMNEFDTVAKRAEEVKRLTAGYGADVVVEVAGVPDAFSEGLHLVRPGGRYMVVGNVALDESQNTTVIPGMVVRKSITVKGFMRYQPWYLNKTIKFVEKYQHKYPYHELAERVFKLSEMQEALELSEAGKVKRAVVATNQ